MLKFIFPEHKFLHAANLCPLNSQEVLAVPDSPLGTDTPFFLSYDNETYLSGDAGPVQQQCCERSGPCRPHFPQTLDEKSCTCIMTQLSSCSIQICVSLSCLPAQDKFSCRERRGKAPKFFIQRRLVRHLLFLQWLNLLLDCCYE